MDRSLHLTHASALIVVAAVLPAAGRVARHAGLPSRHAPRPLSCAALGNYPVGPRASAQAHVAHPHAIQPPPSPWRLAGNVILSAYTGCGQATAGTFSIQGELMGAPAQINGNTVTVPCAQSCLGPALATITATGTIKQDTAHAQDPLYVTITASVTVVRGSRHTRVALNRIMGFLQVAPGQTATLTFLPPPTLSLLPAQTANAGTLPVPVAIYGWRGGL